MAIASIRPELGTRRRTVSWSEFIALGYVDLVRGVLFARSRLGRLAARSDVLKEVLKAYVQSFDDSFEGSDPDFLMAVLKFRQVLSRKARVVGKNGLGHPAFRSQDANTPSNPHADVLGTPQGWNCMSVQV